MNEISAPQPTFFVRPSVGVHVEHFWNDDDFELSRAAVSYIDAVSDPDEWYPQAPNHDWPWAKEWWKPSQDPIRNLVKAGALIAAEIDRLKRRVKR